jgi:hypothetical protein
MRRRVIAKLLRLTLRARVRVLTKTERHLVHRLQAYPDAPRHRRMQWSYDLGHTRAKLAGVVLKLDTLENI